MGVVLLIVAAIHLVVTPLLANVMAERVSEEQWQFLRVPSLINHIVVGVLLIPIGATLIVLAGELRQGSRWAWWLVVRPFLIASILVTLVAITLPVVLLWARPTSR